MNHYVRVCETEDDSPIEIPLENDETLLLSTLTAQFPDCTGLKYKSSDTGCFRGVRLSDDRLYAPVDGNWQGNIFCCVFPKTAKRKADENMYDSSNKLKKLENKTSTDLIVLNLPWKADESVLRNYFSQYGELAMVQIKRDPNTQQSKGYGFIRFTEYMPQVLCLAERHTIENRQCEVRIPISKIEGDRQEISRKVHVGRLTENLSADVLQKYFSKFGRVIDVFIPKPFRSFAFVTFEDPEVATSLLGKDQDIHGTVVSVGSAVPKLPPSARQNANNSRVLANNLNQAGYQNLMNGTQGWQAWPSAYGTLATNGQHHGQQSGRGNRLSVNSMNGLNPATAAVAAVLAAEYTRVNQNRNSTTLTNGAVSSGDFSHGNSESSNNAALATMSILNNPNVVAAIVNAATAGTNNGTTMMTNNTGHT